LFQKHCRLFPNLDECAHGIAERSAQKQQQRNVTRSAQKQQQRNVTRSAQKQQQRNVTRSAQKQWGADKSLARPTSRCILFDG